MSIRINNNIGKSEGRHWNKLQRLHLQSN